MKKKTTKRFVLNKQTMTNLISVQQQKNLQGGINSGTGFTISGLSPCACGPTLFCNGTLQRSCEFTCEMGCGTTNFGYCDIPL
jgi:hypothetical protein